MLWELRLNHWPCKSLCLSKTTHTTIIQIADNRRWINNTFLYDAAGPCPTDATPLHCVGIDGGYFNEGASSTWTQAPNLTSLNAAQEYNTGFDDDVYGTDTVMLSSNVSVSRHPLGIIRGSSAGRNGMGLGVNSTLLSALTSTGAIASRSWGFWEGWTGANSSTQLDGSLVLGGYDAAKVTGGNLTLPISTQGPTCTSGLVITVIDVVMNLRSGANKSIIGPSAGSAFQACVIVDYPLMSMSSDIWDSFITTSKSTPMGRSAAGGFNFRGMLISTEDA